jgi:transcriptional antiterminator NusG
MLEVTLTEATKPETAETGGTKRWYVVHAYSGMEKSVAKTLQERVDRAGLQSMFGRIMVPTEEVVEVKGGKRAITERRLYSGYVLVEMDMTDEAWHLVKSTPKVTGFLGGKANKPSPLPQKEVDEILLRMQEGYEKPRPKVLFEVGEMVRVKDGPFTDFNGNVEEVNYDKSRVRVSVTIFGRSTPVDLEFGQVEKV